MTTLLPELRTSSTSAAEEHPDQRFVPVTGSDLDSCDATCPYCWGPETD